MSTRLGDERIIWSSKQGDGVKRSWTRTTGSRAYDRESLLVQMRNTKTNALIATSADSPAEGVLSIDLELCDFTGPDEITFGFEIPPIGAPYSPDYVIEAQCEVDDVLTTFFSHAWEIRRQYTVPT
jgi:hypothetical protein